MSVTERVSSVIVATSRDGGLGVRGKHAHSLLFERVLVLGLN